MVASARKKLVAHDPTYYPVEDDVGEDSLQTFIAELLRPLLAALFASRGQRVFVGADQFIYWEQFAPTKAVSPDVYVLPGVSPDARVSSWKIWETAITPSFALEIVSKDLRKDVEESPRRYAQFDVPEIVVFDPEPETRQDSARFRVYRRLAKRGLVLVEVTNADRIRSKSLGCFLRAVGEGPETRLRLGLGPRGDELFPTDAERAEAEAARAASEAARAEVESARARAAETQVEAERALRRAAEAELARLRGAQVRARRPSVSQPAAKKPTKR
jgi:hypothetical protein